MNKEGIWVINHFAGSPDHGMVYRSYYLGRKFVNSNEFVRTFASSFSHVRHTNPDIYDFYQEEDIAGINYTWIKNIKYDPSNSILRLLSLILFSLKLLFLPVWKFEKPKAIIVSSPSIFPIFTGWIWSKLFHCKLIFEVRDIWPESLIQLGNVSRKHPIVILIKIIELFAYKACDYCVAVMPTAGKYFTANGLKLSKLKVIPNGVDQSEDLDSDLAIELPKDKFIIGFAGAVGNANNLDLFVDTAKICEDKDIQFVIVGHGEEKARLVKKVNDLNLKNFNFYDSIPKSQVPTLIGHFNLCFISLKYTELFDYGVSPNKLFDYMLAKKPIVYCINSGNSPVVEANCGVEVRENSPEKVLEAIIELKNSGIDNLQSLGNNGSEYVCDKHSYQKLASQYLEIINE